jgi:queuosine precursor transporter
MITETARRRYWTPGLIVLAAYVGTIGAANYAVAHHAPIPVGFGWVAPAGVLFAGLAFTLRNVAQDLVGRVPTLVALALGIVLAYVVATPALAVASAAAFGFSELADFAVYTVLRRRRMLLAYGVAATVGLVIDSALFLWLAFRSEAFLPGQVLGKAEMTALALILVSLYRATNRRAATV